MRVWCDEFHGWCWFELMFKVCIGFVFVFLVGWLQDVLVKVVILWDVY